MTTITTSRPSDRIPAPSTCLTASFVVSSDAHGGGFVGLYGNGQWSGGKSDARATRMTFDQANVYARRLIAGGAYVATIYEAPNLATPVRTFAPGDDKEPVIARGADPDCRFDCHGYCAEHRQARLCWSFANGPFTPLPGGRW